MTLTFGSLFAGIGGLDLGCERAGMTCAWQVEIDPWCRAVLAKHWPNAERFEDVRTVGAATLAPVDVVVGGFPCQDVSLAGRGAGLAGERSGLWFEYLRILTEIRPRGVIVENVGGLARRGLDVVVGGLDGLGYAVEVSRIAAADVGAPHRRVRHFILAYSDGGSGGVADAHGGGCEGGEGLRAWEPVTDGDGETRSSAEPRVGGGADGLPGGLDGAGPDGAWPAGRGEAQHDWEPPRVAAAVPDRPRRLKALGNAVCPQQGFVAAARLAWRLEVA